jgi:hypothetical protein
MENRKKIILAALAVFLLTAAVIKSGMLSSPFEAHTGTRVALNLQEQDIQAAGYRYSFTLDKTPQGNINCYMLKYRADDYNLAVKYAERFIDINSYAENDLTYVFTGNDGTVTIDKEINQIHYGCSATEGAAADASTAALGSDEAAIRTAADYIEKKLLLPLIYEEAQVHFDGETYKVNFINRINNLKNYAFSDLVTMDKTGRILTVDYYTIQYDKVGECHIKSMKEAFAELPALGKDETVVLTGCQLVYIYDDSIIQPAFYFQGSAENDQSFECYVKAAVYG